MIKIISNKFARRPLLVGALAMITGALTFGAVVNSASAQDAFPNKTLSVVTHAGAGGGTDITTRMMLLRARRVLKQDMVVVSKRGGSGSKALMYTNTQPRDGYTFMTITQSHIFQILQGKVPIKIEDLIGVARATDDPQIVVVPASSSIKNLADLIAASKESKGGLKWGSTFAGGADHVAIHNFAKKADAIEYTLVPFKGGGDIVVNLVGGNVDAALLNYAEGETQFSSGELRAIAVLANQRIGSIGDVPTSIEAGVDYTASTVRGFAILKGVPADTLKTLEKGLIKAMNHSMYQTYLSAGGMPANSVVGSEEWTEQINEIYNSSSTALKELGML